MVNYRAVNKTAVELHVLHKMAFFTNRKNNFISFQS